VDELRNALEKRSKILLFQLRFGSFTCSQTRHVGYTCLFDEERHELTEKAFHLVLFQVLEWVFSSGGPSAVAEWAKQRDGDHVPKAGAADSAWDDDDDDIPLPPPPPKSTKGVAPPKKKDADGNDIDEVCNEAVLIFLPGMKEITTLQEAIFCTRGFQSEEARRWVLPLHSTVPPEDQRLVFVRPPPGMKKIVLATNIAETAITIDDIGFVIDTGRMKELRYDPQRRMSSLEDVVVTRANAKQRRGRAGRVREGALMNPYPRACVTPRRANQTHTGAPVYLAAFQLG